MNFVRSTKDLLIGGFVVRDLSLSTPAHTKRRKEENGSLVTAEAVRRSLSALNDFKRSAETTTKQQRVQSQAIYLAAPESRLEIVTELRPVIEQGLNQAHDYMLLLHQIQANAATILEEDFPGVPPEEAAERSTNVGAIWFAAELMLAKIDATAFLHEPNRINTSPRMFSIFKLVHKYVRIYASFARQRDVKLELRGESFALVEYPVEAVGAVVHTLLDNMVKYAPPKSLATVAFSTQRDTLTITYASLGPRIDPDERGKIFVLGYQAEAAKLVAGAGMGFGLAAAKLISDTLNLGLRVRQGADADKRSPGYYLTEFEMQFEIRSDERGRLSGPPRHIIQRRR